jgi:hypothetical protein
MGVVGTRAIENPWFFFRRAKCIVQNRDSLRYRRSSGKLTQPTVAVRCPCLATTYRSRLQRSRTRCPETSVRNYPCTLRNDPEERRSHLPCGGSLKSRYVLYFCTKHFVGRRCDITDCLRYEEVTLDFIVFYTAILYKGVWLRYEVKTPYMTGIITCSSIRISLNPRLPGLLKTAPAQNKKSVMEV